MKKLLMLTVAAAAVAVPAASQAQRVPAATIVLVDTDRVYRECTACRAAQTQLQSQITALQTRQQTLAAQLQPERQAIETAADALNGKEPDAALRTRIQNFQTRAAQAQQELEAAERNLQSIRANVSRQIEARYNPAVTQVMNQRGANIAMDVAATIAHSNAINVTDAVLAALNATLPSVSVTPLPQQQQPQQQQQQPQGR